MLPTHGALGATDLDVGPGGPRASTCQIPLSRGLERDRNSNRGSVEEPGSWRDRPADALSATGQLCPSRELCWARGLGRLGSLLCLFAVAFKGPPQASHL